MYNLLFNPPYLFLLQFSVVVVCVKLNEKFIIIIIISFKKRKIKN